MKKILALILVGVMTFALVSCDVPKTENPNVVEKDDPDKVYVSDPEGYRYTIVCDTGADDSLCPASGTLIGDRLLAHYDAVAKQFSCSIVTEDMLSSKISTRISANAAANIKFADLVQTDAVTVSRLYKANYLTALEDIPAIDAESEKWGLASQREFMTFNGKSYGFYGLWLGASFPTVSGVTLYNRDMLDEYNIEDPMELYEKGDWTWSSFLNIAKRVTLDTGDDSGTYAMASPNAAYPDFITSAIASNGGTRYVYSEEGIPSCGYNDYPTLDALTWVRSLVSEYSLAYPLKMNYDNGYLDVLAFTNGRTAFLVTNSYVGICAEPDYPLETFEDACGWLPFPIGPSAEEGTSSSYFGENDTFCAVAVTDTQSIYNGAPILNALFECMEGDSPDAWKTAMYDNYFFDEASFNVYLELLASARDIGEITEPSLNSAISSRFADVVSGVESVAKAVEEIESAVNAYIGE